MTHTIHPKMLEKVKLALLEDGLKYNFGEKADVEQFIALAEDGNPAFKKFIKFMETQAKAAILAMWEGLPMEDAPRYGKFLAHRKSTNFYEPAVLWDKKLSRVVRQEDGKTWTSDKFIPVPKQGDIK